MQRPPPTQSDQHATKRTKRTILIAVAAALGILLVAFLTLLLLERGSGGEGDTSGPQAGLVAGGAGHDGEGGEGGTSGPQADPVADGAGHDSEEGADETPETKRQVPPAKAPELSETEDDPVAFVFYESKEPDAASSSGNAGIGGPSGGGGDAPSFFDIWDKGSRLAYVVDRSGSMRGLKIMAVKEELARSIRSLDPGKEFYIVFYDDGPLPMQPERLLPATDANKQKALLWVQTVQTMGGTQPMEAMRIALGMNPDAIFLLSDGQFDTSVAEQIRAENRAGKVRIHTIAFHDASGEEVLRKIAEENGGVYHFVPGSPDARPSGVAALKAFRVTRPGSDDIGSVLGGMGPGFQYDTIRLEDLAHSDPLNGCEVLFINCGSAGGLARMIAPAIRKFVEYGGTLYCSDWAGGVLQEAFPGVIAFDQFGSPCQLDCDVIDPGLQEVIGKRVKVTFDLPAWWQIRNVSPSVRVHIAFQRHPIVVGFSHGRGHVIYTSFHNHAQTSKEELKLLRYLVLRPVMARAAAGAAATAQAQQWVPSKEIIGTIDRGGSSQPYVYEASAGEQVMFILSWIRRGELKMTVQDPSGRIAFESSSATSPLEFGAANAQPGPWSCTIEAVDVPYDNFPYVLTVATQ